ncbi:MAG: heat-shock protein Hsp90 [Methanomicrobiales archaeon]|nr:heat-shock protein Hsp90 [Methanomicrobiales archaeon]
MQSNPNDDIFRTISKIMEDLVKKLALQEGPQFVGYTIITGPGEAPEVIRLDPSAREETEIDCEMEELEDRFYITADVVSDENCPTYAEIRPRSVTISSGGNEQVIELPCEVDLVRSYYETRHGVMDVVCVKRAPLP